jgi:hypothetical protein
MSNVLLLNACVIVWLISLPLRDVSIVDIAWGLGFVLVAWTSLLAGTPSESNLLLPVLTTVWGLRLSGYLSSSPASVALIPNAIGSDATTAVGVTTRLLGPSSGRPDTRSWAPLSATLRLR